MTRQFQGRVSVQGTEDGVTFKLGEVIRVRGAVPKFNRTFQEYRIVGTPDPAKNIDYYTAEVTLCKPTSNKFQVGGPVIRG